MLTPQQIAQKWLANSRTAGDSIKAGVNAMTEADNPMVKAAQAEDRWAAGVQRAAQEKRFSVGLSRVTFQQWKQAMLGKGLQNYVNGLADGAVKMQAFQTQFQPFIQEGRARLGPRGTLEQNIARSTEMQRWLATWRTRGSGALGLFPTNINPFGGR